jgi:hypothetical protein
MLGALGSIFFGLWRTLRFGRRIADGFGQHLAQFGLVFGGSRLGGCPWGHNQHLGMPEGDLTPYEAYIKGSNEGLPNSMCCEFYWHQLVFALGYYLQRLRV